MAVELSSPAKPGPGVSYPSPGVSGGYTPAPWGPGMSTNQGTPINTGTGYAPGTGTTGGGGTAPPGPTYGNQVYTGAWAQGPPSASTPAPPSYAAAGASTAVIVEVTRPFEGLKAGEKYKAYRSGSGDYFIYGETGNVIGIPRGRMQPGEGQFLREVGTMPNEFANATTPSVSGGGEFVVRPQDISRLKTMENVSIGKTEKLTLAETGGNRTLELEVVSMGTSSKTGVAWGMKGEPRLVGQQGPVNITQENIIPVDLRRLSAKQTGQETRVLESGEKEITTIYSVDQKSGFMSGDTFAIVPKHPEIESAVGTTLGRNSTYDMTPQLFKNMNVSSTARPSLRILGGMSDIAKDVRYAYPTTGQEATSLTQIPYQVQHPGITSGGPGYVLGTSPLSEYSSDIRVQQKMAQDWEKIPFTTKVTTEFANTAALYAVPTIGAVKGLQTAGTIGKAVLTGAGILGTASIGASTGVGVSQQGLGFFTSTQGASIAGQTAAFGVIGSMVPKGAWASEVVPKTPVPIETRNIAYVEMYKEPIVTPHGDTYVGQGVVESMAVARTPGGPKSVLEVRRIKVIQREGELIGMKQEPSPGLSLEQKMTTKGITKGESIKLETAVKLDLMGGPWKEGPSPIEGISDVYMGGGGGLKPKNVKGVQAYPEELVVKKGPQELVLQDFGKAGEKDYASALTLRQKDVGAFSTIVGRKTTDKFDIRSWGAQATTLREGAPSIDLLPKTRGRGMTAPPRETLRSRLFPPKMDSNILRGALPKTSRSAQIDAFKDLKWSRGEKKFLKDLYPEKGPVSADMQATIGGPAKVRTRPTTPGPMVMGPRFQPMVTSDLAVGMKSLEMLTIPRPTRLGEIQNRFGAIGGLNKPGTDIWNTGGRKGPFGGTGTGVGGGVDVIIKTQGGGGTMYPPMTRTKRKEGVFGGQESMVDLGEAIGGRRMPATSVMNRVDIGQALAQRQETATMQRTATRQKIPMVPTESFTTTRPFKWSMPKFAMPDQWGQGRPEWPSMGPGSRMGSKYKASAVANVFNIRGSAPKTITGFEWARPKLGRRKKRHG